MKIKEKTAWKKPRSMSEYVPFTSLHGRSDIFTKQNDIVRTWLIQGIPFETCGQQSIDENTDALHQLIKSITGDNQAGEHISVYQHTVQRKTKAPDIDESFGNDFARDVYAEYQSGLQDTELFVVDLYLTIVYRCSESNGDGLLKLFTNSLKRQASTGGSVMHARTQALNSMEKIGRDIESNLKEYSPRLLTEYEDDKGNVISEPLSFQSLLIDSYSQPVMRPVGVPLWEYLGSSSYETGRDVIELSRGNDRRYAQMVQIKGYKTGNYAGMLRGLYKLPVEFISCVTYCGLHKQNATKRLQNKAEHLDAINDNQGAIEAESILSGLLADEYTVGEMTVTLRIIADSVQRVLDDTSKVMSEIRSLGYVVSTTRISTDAAYVSQIPGNFKYRTDVPLYTSANLCDVSPLINHHEGKAKGNPWGNSVLTMKTSSNRISHLNLHHVENLDDATGSRPHSATVILGQSGSGKTSLMNMIHVAMQKYNPLLTFTFDVKRGCQRTIEAMDGSYTVIQNGIDTGYNPWKMEPTDDNILFLDDLVNYLCSQEGNRVTTSEKVDIERAIRSAMKQPKDRRGFEMFLQCLNTESGENSLQQRISKWSFNDATNRKGKYHWALDCAEDTLNFDKSSIIGIDGEKLLENPAVATPVLMYILHRINQVVGTRRVALFMDEAHMWLGDEQISEWVANTLATIRSKDGVVVLATQMPESIIDSKAGMSAITNAASFLYMRNPRANRSTYEKLGMTSSEYKELMKLNQYHFLYKQKTSVTGTVDISPLSESNKSIISGKTI